MLSIGKTGAGQHHYYLDMVAEGAEEYYSGEGEAAGYWLGDAAEELGLEGHVEPAQLVAMLTGMDPATGEPLGLRHVAGRGPVPGFDLTFSAPKSVSLTWAMGGDDAGAEIAAAHAEAVDAALGYLQREACWTRRGAGGHEFLPGNGFIAAAYVHRSSRAGDPHLHTHVLIANATKGPDGRWTRLYHPAIYNQAKAAGYLYEAVLRKELTRRLGIDWEAPVNGIADVKGFSAEQVAHFSQRKAAILEAAGPNPTAKQLQIATLATRQAKDRDLTDADIRQVWRERAAEVGLTREQIRSTIGRAREAEQVLTVDQLAREVTARASHFDRRDAIQAVAGLLRQGATVEKVEALADSFLASEQVIAIGRSPKGERFTTRRIWELERQALASAGSMASERDRALAHEIVIARTLAGRPSMKPDQEEMVRRLLGGGEGIVVVVGEAGSGKTYATTAAAEGWAAAGIEVRAAAPTWRAANVLRSEGLDATSVAKLLGQLDSVEGRGLALGSVLLVDEAGMVGSAELARLIDHAERARTKLVLIGDPAQLGEIEAGGLFAAIAERTEAIRLHEVIRHSHELDREGARRIRLGEGSEAFSVYLQEGRVFVAADPAARREAMVGDWWRSFGAGEDALMIAKSNREVERLNSLARELMRAEGRLGETEIEIGGERFAAGDQVITRINDHRNRIYNRERWQVAEVDPKAQTVALDGIDTARRVCVDSVFLRRVRERDGGPAIEHAYAATTYQAQGATVDRAFIAAEPSMDRQEFYVAASRSREETFFYATPEIQLHREEIAPADPYLREGIEHIAEAAQRDGAQVSAHDQALLSRYADLPVGDLYRARDELRSEAREEQAFRSRRDALEKRIGEEREALARIPERAAQADALPRREREHEFGLLGADERMREEKIQRLEAERAQLPELGPDALAELAAVERVIGQRVRAVLTADQLAPPDYIVKELGERPSDPAKQQTWDRAVRRIEGYRLEHGIDDRDAAFGPRPPQGVGRAHWDGEQRRLRDAQRSLNPELYRARSIERGIDLGR